MLQATLYLVTAIGGVAFVLAVARQEPSQVGVFAAIALVAWSIIAFQADSITTVTQSGATLTYSQPTLEYLALGLALVSALGVISAFTDS